MTKEDFMSYCLLYAADADFNITKQDVILVASNIEPEDFVRVYNVFEMDGDKAKIERINEHKSLYIKNEEEKREFLDRIKEVFFTDRVNESVERSVMLMLKNIL